MHDLRDPTNRLILESEVSAAVMGKGEEFALYFLNAALDAEAALAESESKGYSYCGVFAVCGGEPRIQIEHDNPEAAHVMCVACIAFSREVVHLLGPMPKSDGAEWLTRLHTLQDPRG